MGGWFFRVNVDSSQEVSASLSLSSVKPRAQKFLVRVLTCVLSRSRALRHAPFGSGIRKSHGTVRTVEGERSEHTCRTGSEFYLDARMEKNAEKIWAKDPRETLI